MNQATLAERLAWAKQRGQSMIEYSLVLFAVVVIGVAAFGLFQQRQAEFMEDVGDAVLVDKTETQKMGKGLTASFKTAYDSNVLYVFKKKSDGTQVRASNYNAWKTSKADPDLVLVRVQGKN